MSRRPRAAPGYSVAGAAGCLQAGVVDRAPSHIGRSRRASCSCVPRRPRPARTGCTFELNPDDQAAEVRRLISLGAEHVDIGQQDVSWVVLADPEGNEFCVLSPQP
ncbi:MAG: VOC family protein [Micromonosporaceae bacterium]